MGEKEIKYDRYARRRMKWRKISQAEIEQTLKDPDKTGAYPKMVDIDRRGLRPCLPYIMGAGQECPAYRLGYFGIGSEITAFRIGIQML